MSYRTQCEPVSHVSHAKEIEKAVNMKKKMEGSRCLTPKRA